MNNKVEVRYKCTCEACPTQYEGTIKGGQTRDFYFRYRYGHWKLEIGHPNETPTDAPIWEYAGGYGDSMDGVMSEDMFFGILMGIISGLYPNHQVVATNVTSPGYFQTHSGD